MAVPLIDHTVRKGENLTAIVKLHGFPGGKWKEIYNASYNSAFRKKRPDPNLILPGDVFKLPSIPKSELEKDVSLLAPIIGVFEKARKVQEARLATIVDLRAKAKKSGEYEQKKLAAQMKQFAAGVPADAEFKQCKKARSREIFGPLFSNCEARAKHFGQLNIQYAKLAKKLAGKKETKFKELDKEMYLLERSVRAAIDTCGEIIGTLKGLQRELSAAGKGTV